MNGPGSFLWLARHELRLAWRDWVGLMTGGKRGRAPVVALVVLAIAIFMHLLAYHLISGRSGHSPRSGRFAHR